MTLSSAARRSNIASNWSMRQEQLLTVLIPLHKAGPWVPTVSETIERCPKGCRILVSDRTHEDGALAALKSAHGSDSRISFLDAKGAPGWREHVNWLLSQVHTELFSIMAQDDSIEQGYYEQLVAAHCADRRLAISFGSILAYNIPGRSGTLRFPGLPFKTAQAAPWEEAIELAARWNLGIAYRGVIRKQYARSIAPTVQDRFADVIWVFGLALHGYLREVASATYHKRYHQESVHATWSPLTIEERCRYLSAELQRRFRFRPFTLAHRRGKLLDRLRGAAHIAPSH